MRENLYQQITSQIVEALERGVPPWRRPWLVKECGLPRNVATKRLYKGVNTWLLLANSFKNGWTSGLFGTYRCWQKLGGHVQRGQKGNRIVFWDVKTRKTTDYETGHEKEKKRFFSRQFTVFALEQCGGDALDRVREPIPEGHFDDFEPAEEVIEATGANIRFGGSQAFYYPPDDFIQMPYRECFDSPADFYSTAMHELAHWSGHPSRLDRGGRANHFGDDSYVMEELIAEMAGAFMCAELGVANETAETHPASYIAEWIRILRDDHRVVIAASSAAAKAADFVLSFNRQAEPAVAV